MLATLTRPDGGRALVLGHDVVADPAGVRREVSLTGQLASVDEDLTRRENLLLLGRLLGLKRPAAKRRPADLLEEVGVAGRRFRCSRPPTSLAQWALTRAPGAPG